MFFLYMQYDIITLSYPSRFCYSDCFFQFFA